MKSAEKEAVDMEEYSGASAAISLRVILVSMVLQNGMCTGWDLLSEEDVVGSGEERWSDDEATDSTDSISCSPSHVRR